METSKEKILSHLMQLCSKQEQCEQAMLDKAIKMGLSFADANAVVTKLREEGFVDNSRYAAAFARDKSKINGWGSVKIAFHLRAKHIAEEAIKDAVKEIDDDKSKDKLLSALKTKNKGLVNKQLSKEERYIKLLRFALSRGFKQEEATDAIKQIL